jgi:hypothetical protein
MPIPIVCPASLPMQPAVIQRQSAEPGTFFRNSQARFSANAASCIQILTADQALPPAAMNQEKLSDEASDAAGQSPVPQSPSSEPKPEAGNTRPRKTDRQPFWERVFNIPPLQIRIEKALSEKWKFDQVRPRHIELLLSDDEIEMRRFFLDSSNAARYQRLVKEYGCGFEGRNGRVTDDSFETLSEYGPELLEKYEVLMENRDIIKRYFAGVFRDGRIGSQSLIKISHSMWFSVFEVQKFRMFASMLNKQFQVPEHVIGPMLASVGDSFWLPKVMARKTAPQEFRELLGKIAPSTEGSGNAFAPTLQLLVIGEEHKIPYKTLSTFVQDLRLRPQDFAPFSAIVFNLSAYRLAHEIKCPTFAQFLRRQLDEFGPDINQQSGRLFVLSYREFKDNSEALQSLLSPDYRETKAFLKSIGTPIPATVWNMERIAVLSQTLTPEKRSKIARVVQELSEELSVADIVFLSDIVGNEEEVKLLTNRKALLAGVKDIPIDRIVERSHNDLVKELEREIDNANRNGLFRSVRRLANMINKEKLAYTERVDPDKLTNIQLSRLLIFHRSIEMPGFLNTVGWNVSMDLQNDRSEGGGYLGYDKDMAMVTMVPGQPGNNRAYRPVNLTRAPASLALFHNHAFEDTFMERYFGFLAKFFPRNKNKDKYAGPSGWLGAEKGDITAAAESGLPSFIITKIGHPQNPDGSRNMKALLVNFDWVVVDPLSGEALRSDRGVFTVPYYGEAQLGKLKWPSRKEQKRREKELRDKCPLGIVQNTEARPAQTGQP